ncbi:MAG: cytochrome c [Saprospiraceae bacterium]
MKKILFFGFIALTVLVLSCQQEPANKNEKVDTAEISAIENLQLLQPAEGVALLKTNCFACHNPQSNSHEDMLAPPLAGIKYKYQQHYPERTNFIAKMSDFVHTPTKENAIMKGPVRRFGLMPPVPLQLEQIRQISAFIYDNKLEIPDWFSDHFEEQHGKEWK